MEGDAEERLHRVGGAPLLVHVTDLVSTAHEHLVGGLVAAYVVGSIAAGDATATSDIDLLLVAPQQQDDRLRSLGERLADQAADGPLRGLEAVLYRAEVLARPTYPLPYELNVNAGAGLPRLVDMGGTDAFWFLLDVAAAREHAVVLAGPPAHAVIAPVPDALVVAALRDSARWHVQHGAGTPDAVLNACRAWHWLERRRWVSKTDAGTWAAGRPSAPAVVRVALAAREIGGRAGLDPGAVRSFLAAVAQRLDGVS